MIKTIITHPGGAHKDDFLACSVLLSNHPVSIFRRDPTEQELEDPEVAVVDIGHQHDPKLNNFDHHQLPRDHEPTCALSWFCKSLKSMKIPRSFAVGWRQPSGLTAGDPMIRLNGWVSTGRLWPIKFATGCHHVSSLC